MDILGMIFESNCCGKFKVVEKSNRFYTDYRGVKTYYWKCIFLETNFVKYSLKTAILNGNVKDYRHKSVYNVGCLGDDYEELKDGDIYETWIRMMGRCYNQNNKSYKFNNTVCERWHNYCNFHNDYKKLLGYEDMINNSNVKFSLDKDFIKEGNKIYSFETCIIIPQELNTFIFSIPSNKRKYKFEGIYLRGDSFRSSVRCDKKTLHLITTKNPVLAHSIYWDKKLNILNEKLYTDFDFLDMEIKNILVKKVDNRRRFSENELSKAIQYNDFN